jgi:hypothetical protein
MTIQSTVSDYGAQFSEDLVPYIQEAVKLVPEQQIEVELIGKKQLDGTVASSGNVWVRVSRGDILMGDLHEFWTKVDELEKSGRKSKEL